MGNIHFDLRHVVLGEKPGKEVQTGAFPLHTREYRDVKGMERG